MSAVLYSDLLHELLRGSMIKVISTLKERIKRKNGESFKTATRALCMLDECCLAADPHDAAFCTPLPPFVSLTLTHVLASLEKIATGNKGIFSFLNKKKPTGRSIEEEEVKMPCLTFSLFPYIYGRRKLPYHHSG